MKPNTTTIDMTKTEKYIYAGVYKNGVKLGPDVF